MDIYNFEPPNILFLRGCFLDDCNSVEDLFDQKLMIESATNHEYYEMKNTQYDEIPTTFVSLDAWPKKTNLKCWSCDCSFQTRPIFIPLSMGRSGQMDVKGNFCLWGCAAQYINLHYDADERWEKLALLRILYKIFTCNTITHIVPSSPKTEMIQYGGKKTIKEYRDNLLQLNSSYETAIRHNSIHKLLSEDLNHEE
jgi:hypothetical protein